MEWIKSNSATRCLVPEMGESDINSYRALLALEDDARDVPYIVLDVSGKDFADPTHLRFLIRVLAYAREKDVGSIRLVGANRNLRRVLEATGLSRKVTYESKLA